MKRHLTILFALLAIQNLAFATTDEQSGNFSLAAASAEPNIQKRDDGKSEGDTITLSVDKNFKDSQIQKPSDLFNFKSDEALSDANATTLINKTLGVAIAQVDTPGQLRKDDYCVIHVVRWKKLAADTEKPSVVREIWFLYKAEQPSVGNLIWKRQKDFDGKRIFGSKRVAVLLVHLDALTVQGDANKLAWDISYKVAINKKTPAPFKHAIDLIGALSPAGGAAPGAAVPSGDFWGGQMLDVNSVPSDIVVSASIAIEGQQNKEFTNTYDNEGRYHWDVSLGVPVTSIRELQFVSEGNRVTTAAKERQNVYGFLNIYPVAVDVKDDKAFTVPHFVFGVPLASKPLHHPLVGIGTGIYKTPIKFNIFAGVIFNRERVPRTLIDGQAATAGQLDADLRTRWVRKFTFGINFPIGQIKDALKK